MYLASAAGNCALQQSALLCDQLGLVYLCHATLSSLWRHEAGGRRTFIGPSHDMNVHGIY